MMKDNREGRYLMQLGLIGLPLVGKTALFELLTENRNQGTGQGRANLATVRIPDWRIDFLSELYQPQKTAYAQLEVIDIPGLVPGSEKGSSSFLNAVREADALIHVVRAFEVEEFPHVEGSIDALRDIELINYELLLADLDLVERRIERIKTGKKPKQHQEELDLLERLAGVLGDEMPIASLKLNDEEDIMLRSFQFLTMKPMMLVVNVEEEHVRDGRFSGREEVLEFAEERDIPVLTISARLEGEIAELEGEEKQLFMQELGIEEPGIIRLARAAYRLLGLISFFTVGDDEVKAWTISEGLPARQAAGKIHSDIERGFIRAEVVNFNDLYTYGSMARVREEGLFRLEGKDYPVQDGEIVHFRFNV